MRFPVDIPLMHRLKQLFLHPEIASQITLIDFLFAPEKGNSFLYYNNIRQRKNTLPKPLGDVFQFADVGVTKRDPDYFNPDAGFANISEDVIAPFVKELAEDLKVRGRVDGWKYLMTVDKYSTRGYMSTKYRPSKKLNIGSEVGVSNDVINWCETMAYGTGWYDRAFSEAVLEAMAFGAPEDPSKLKWKCIK